MRYSASETDMPDTGIISLFGTVYIDHALATSICINRDIKPPYFSCGMRLPCGRGVWIVGLTDYPDQNIAYFWDWRDARDFMRAMNKKRES